MATLSYHEQKDIENIKKLRELQKELPSFCSDFFRGIERARPHGPGLPMHMI